MNNNYYVDTTGSFQKKDKAYQKQINRIHDNQPLDNCYVDIGDLVEITTKEKQDNVYQGEILDFGLRIQSNTEYDGFHPCITIGVFPKDEQGYDALVMLWIENIYNIRALRLGKNKETSRYSIKP